MSPKSATSWQRERAASVLVSEESEIHADEESGVQASDENPNEEEPDLEFEAWKMTIMR